MEVSKKWTIEKAKLKDWNHYSIKIRTLKDDFENFNLREFEVEITKQNPDLSTTKFKKIKIETCFIDLLQDLIPKLKMYSCYMQFNDSGYYDLNVYNFFNDICKWRNHVQNIYQKHDKKQIEYESRSL